MQPNACNLTQKQRNVTISIVQADLAPTAKLLARGVTWKTLNSLANRGLLRSVVLDRGERAQERYGYFQVLTPAGKQLAARLQARAN